MFHKILLDDYFVLFFRCLWAGTWVDWGGAPQDQPHECSHAAQEMCQPSIPLWRYAFVLLLMCVFEYTCTRVKNTQEIRAIFSLIQWNCYNWITKKYFNIVLNIAIFTMGFDIIDPAKEKIFLLWCHVHMSGFVCMFISMAERVFIKSQLCLTIWGKLDTNQGSVFLLKCQDKLLNDFPSCFLLDIFSVISLKWIIDPKCSIQ